MRAKRTKRLRGTKTTRRAAQRRGHPVPGLAEPVLQFNLDAEIERLHQEEAWLREAGRSSTTLVKHPDFRLVLIAMKANTQMHEHKAAGRISVQTLRGHVRLHLPGGTVDVPAGHLLALDRALPHDVEALEESAFLLTISWFK